MVDYSKPLIDQAWKRTNNASNLGREYEPVYSGALSFCRRPYSSDSTNSDIVVTGIPYDGAVSFRPGARLGPREIRAASVQLAELIPYPWGKDPFDKLRVTDAGDCFLNPHSPETIANDIENHAAKIIESGAKVLALGGDHFISYPLLKAHYAKYGKLALLHFDAHTDTWDMGSPLLDHGTMFLRAAKEGLIDIDNSLQIGIRTHCDELNDLRYISSRDVHVKGVEWVLQQIKQTMSGRKVYMTFDIDCLDPAFAPGVGTPVPGGLHSWQALELVRGLSGLDIVGCDVVEVCPPFDTSEITALAAAHVAHDWICSQAF